MNADTEQKLLNLLSDDPSLILLLKGKYITDSMWRLCIQKEPALFQCMKNPSNEMCLFALAEDGNNLKHILESDEVKPTREMIWTAVKSYPPIILDIPSHLITESLKECAFDRDPSLMRYYDRIRHTYLERKLMEDPTLVRYLKRPTDEMWIEAIKRQPSVCAYLQYPISQKLYNFIKTECPQVENLLYIIRNTDSSFSEH